MMLNRNIFKIHPEVETALAEKRAVVALESTVIAHGLPRPLNLETAQRMEGFIRESRAVPATIAILEGKICVGLTAEELDQLAHRDDIKKISRRDLPIAIARKWDGATTVATTTWAAKIAGIEVFSTGGIGGVHRGELPDVSADLPELAHTPLIVVCSGAKIVLDLPATREWLETHGVTVLGYGCDEMPAFYSRSSGLPVDVRVDSPEEVAAIAWARREIATEGALLLTVPVPAEAEVSTALLQSVLADALSEAQDGKIAGRDLTPFLLSRMGQASGGATLQANVSLLENNAKVAASVAQALLPADERS